MLFTAYPDPQNESFAEGGLEWSSHPQLSNLEVTVYPHRVEARFTVPEGVSGLVEVTATSGSSTAKAFVAVSDGNPIIVPQPAVVGQDDVIEMRAYYPPNEPWNGGLHFGLWMLESDFAFMSQLLPNIAAALESVRRWALWSCEEGSGDVIEPSTLALLSFGDVTGNFSWTNGRRGLGLELSGGVVTFRAHDGFAELGRNGLTMAAWVKTSESNAGVILGKADADSNGSGAYAVLRIENGVAQFAAGTSAASQSVTGSRQVSDGEWHHVAAVRSGQTIRLYVDGRLEGAHASGSVPADLASAQTTLHVGRLGATGGGFTGVVDELFVASEPLPWDALGRLLADGVYGALPQAVTELDLTGLPLLRQVVSIHVDAGTATIVGTTMTFNGEDISGWEPEDIAALFENALALEAEARLVEAGGEVLTSRTLRALWAIDPVNWRGLNPGNDTVVYLPHGMYGQVVYSIDGSPPPTLPSPPTATLWVVNVGRVVAKDWQTGQTAETVRNLETNESGEVGELITDVGGCVSLQAFVNPSDAPKWPATKPRWKLLRPVENADWETLTNSTPLTQFHLSDQEGNHVLSADSSPLLYLIIWAVPKPVEGSLTLQDSVGCESTTTLFVDGTTITIGSLIVHAGRKVAFTVDGLFAHTSMSVTTDYHGPLEFSPRPTPKLVMIAPDSGFLTLPWSGTYTFTVMAGSASITVEIRALPISVIPIKDLPTKTTTLADGHVLVEADWTAFNTNFQSFLSTKPIKSSNLPNLSRNDPGGIAGKINAGATVQFPEDSCVARAAVYWRTCARPDKKAGVLPETDAEGPGEGAWAFPNPLGNEMWTGARFRSSFWAQLGSLLGFHVPQYETDLWLLVETFDKTDKKWKWFRATLHVTYSASRGEWIPHPSNFSNQKPKWEKWDAQKGWIGVP